MFVLAWFGRSLGSPPWQIARLASRGRGDDAAEVVRRRLATFRADTMPVLELLRDRGALHTVLVSPASLCLHALGNQDCGSTGTATSIVTSIRRRSRHLRHDPHHHR